MQAVQGHFHHFEAQGSVTEKGGSFHVNGKTMSVNRVTRSCPCCLCFISFPRVQQLLC